MLISQLPQPVVEPTPEPTRQLSKLLKLKSLDQRDPEYITTTYTCNVLVKLTLDSRWNTSEWGRKYSKEDEVRIKQIKLVSARYIDEEDGSILEADYVYAKYSINGKANRKALWGSWTIYGDTGFEKAVSELVGYPITFTEQGMQANGYAMLAESW
jgi:hypothetical protein